LGVEARLAEEVGFDGLMLNEHIVSPPEVTDSRHPYGERYWDRRSEFPDPWVAIGHLSAVTTRLRFCTAVSVLACHETFAFARAVATAARLSSNRIMVGVGTGWLHEDFDAAGTDFASRGPRTDEMLRTLPELWAGKRVAVPTPTGTSELELVPPLPTAPVPLLYGGISKRGIERAAGLDGWIGAALDLDHLAIVVSALHAERQARGLADRPFHVITSLRGELSAKAVQQAAALGVTGIAVGSPMFGDARVMSDTERRARFETFRLEVMAPLRRKA
jgi:alkanesulfonate monooxygenase SsuD/methylene tetrahydromethanopterin reductase-like flavin-dependent oxidoreductase (luciferase family)